MRNPYFDNAKATLIILVVIGHILEIYIQNNYIVEIVQKFIYIFHMPAFVLLSGYFSKYIKNLSKSELKYILMYLFTTLLFYPFTNLNLFFMLLMPYYVSWYLISLAFWYILLQFFIKLKHSIVLSIIIAILFGYLPIRGEFLSISRTFVFFPFFLIGYYCENKHFEFLQTKKLSAIICLVIIFIGLFFVNFNYKWLWNCYTYLQLNHLEWYAGLFRVIQLIISTIATMCFFALILNNQNKFTFLGKYTLIIFFAHAFIITIFTNSIIINILMHILY